MRRKNKNTIIKINKNLEIISRRRVINMISTNTNLSIKIKEIRRI